jgi:hypothetical protein
VAIRTIEAAQARLVLRSLGEGRNRAFAAFSPRGVAESCNHCWMPTAVRHPQLAIDRPAATFLAQSISAEDAAATHGIRFAQPAGSSIFTDQGRTGDTQHDKGRMGWL